MGEVKMGTTVGESLDRLPNLRGLNALAKLIKPERQILKGVHVIKSLFAQAFKDIIC